MLLGCLSETDRMIINGGWQRAAIIVSACSCTILSCACTMGTKCMLPTQWQLFMEILMLLFLVTSTGEEDMVAWRQMHVTFSNFLQVQTKKYEQITSLSNQPQSMMWCCILLNHLVYQLSWLLRQLGFGTEHNTSLLIENAFTFHYSRQNIQYYGI